MERKEFIRSVFRATILAGITLVVGTLAFKKKIIPLSDCEKGNVCRKCNRLAGCALPNGIKERNNGKG